MALSKIDQLEGPDKYHVIIGHCKKDSGIAEKIKYDLRKRGLLVYEHAEESFDTGITQSRKVLLLVTKNASNGEDLRFNDRLERAIQKTKARCTECLVLVLINMEFSDMSEELRSKLWRFSSVRYHDDDAFQNKLIAVLSTEALPDPAMVPKLQMGFTLACSYYHNYLRIVLPGQAQRLKLSGLMDINGDIIMSYKMFIIIPASGNCPAELSDYDIAVTSYASISFNVSQAGISGRDYRTNVSQILLDENGSKKEYRAVIEYPAPLNVLKTMAEHHDSSGLTSDDCQREMKQFYFHLRAWLLKDDLEDRARLVYAEDVCPGSKQILELLVNAIKEEVQKESGNPVPGATYSREIREVKAPHLKAIREHLAVPIFKLCHTGPTRGRCYVFNNETFTPQSGLIERQGAQQDMDHVKELFEKLKFEISQFDNLVADDMMEQFAGMADEDFSEDRAVVVVIMTHGNLGTIFGTDGKPMKITYLTHQLDQNSTLKGKPKMFFIQACQTGSRCDEDEEREEAGYQPSPESLGIEVPLETISISNENQDDANVEDSTETEAAQESPNAVIGGATIRVEPRLAIEVLGTDFEDDAVPGGKDAKAHLVPGAPDFLMSYATLPGRGAFRHTDKGNPYIKTLRDLLLKHHSEMALDRILKKVTQEVKNIMEIWFPEEHFRLRQHPFFLDTTEKLIIFT